MNFKQKFIAYKAIVHKEMKRMFRAWSQTLFPPLITTTLYFLIFGQIMGSRIGLVEGFPYVQYIAPGLIMLSLITNAYSSTVSAFFLAKFQRSIEELLVSPASEGVILAGYVTGGVIRALLTGLLVAAIALCFTHIHLYSIISVLMVAILSASIFSLAGIINAIFAKKFDDISIIPVFILTPLTYLGGVFFSLQALSPFWYYASHANPIFYIVETFRYGFLGLSGNYVLPAFAIMLALALLAFYFAYFLLKTGVGLRE